MVYRDLAAQPEAEEDFAQFLEELHTALTDGRRDPNEVVRDTLFQIYYGNQFSTEQSAGVSQPAARAVIHTFDPRNVTTEPEYYLEIEPRVYAERKPFIWLWQMFDRSPLGHNA